MDGGSFIIAEDLEDGFSGGGGSAACVPYHHPIRRRGSYRSTVKPLPPARSTAAAAPGFFWEELSDEEPLCHFLDSCFLCRTPIAGNRDIFMYRGDTPFCSEECRQQQIEMDDAKERRAAWKLRPSSARQQEQRKSASPDSQKIHGTVVAG